MLLDGQAPYKPDAADATDAAIVMPAAQGAIVAPARRSRVQAQPAAADTASLRNTPGAGPPGATWRSAKPSVNRQRHQGRAARAAKHAAGVQILLGYLQ